MTNKDIIEQFVQRYEKRSQNTVKNYRSTLHQYFKTIKKDPNTYLSNRKEAQIKQDIQQYWDTLTDKPPKTRDAKLFCIKSFMMRNGIEIKNVFYKELRESVKDKGTVTQDRTPKTEELQKILQHARVRERAWILLGCTSGMRIGEILKLDMDDLHLDQNPPYIYLPGNTTKNGHPRFTFCTEETKEALIEWKRARPEYIKKLNGKNNLPRATRRYHNPNDTRLFPFSYIPFIVKWKELTKTLKMTEKDKRTGRQKLHIHCLRKFCKTRMLLSMPEPMVNHIIGHSTYLSQEYNRFEPEQIAPFYKKAIPDLSIMSSPDQQETQKRIQRLEQENREMKEDIDRLMRKIVTQ